MGQLASDNFTRANENPLSDGGNWSAVTGLDALEVASDLCEVATASNNACGMAYTGVSCGNNQYAEVTVNSPSGSAYTGVVPCLTRR